MRPHLTMAALMAALLLSAAPAAALRRVYVANLRADSVAVVDADRRTVLGEIAVGDEPDGVAVSPDGAVVYVANFADDSVSVIDTASDTVVATIAVGDGPVGLAVSPDGGEVYVTHKLGGSVGVLDTGTRTLVASIGLDAGSGPDAVAFTPDGRTALVTRSFRDSVAVIDTRTRRVVSSVVVGDRPNRVVVDAGGGYAYLTLFGGVQNDDGSVYRLIELELSSLTVTRRAITDREPMGLALSPDGRTLFVAEQDSVGRFAVASLSRVGTVPLSTLVGAVAVLDAPDVLLATLPWRDGLRFLPAGFGFDPVQGGTTLAMPFGAYALAALPARDPEPLVAAIHEPAFGVKLDPSAQLAVRVTAAAGSAPLGAWSLVLRRRDGREPDRPLAGGDTPVREAVVATVAGADLAAGAAWTLLLTVTSPDGPVTTRERQFFVPDRRYAAVPFSGSRIEYEARVEMSADGQRFVRPNSGGVRVTDAVTGVSEYVMSRLTLTDLDRARLSRNGRRLGVLAGGVAGSFDLETGFFALAPYRPYFMDLDAEGRWLAGYRTNDRDERYQLFDLATGERRMLSAQDGDEASCANEEAQFARINADGTRLAFVTGLELGLGPATGCRLIAYDRLADTFAVVAELGDRASDAPSLDDAGAQFAAVLGPSGSAAGPRRATLFYLDSGATRELLPDVAADAYDAVLSGDGTAVLVSSCADLDPTVGNADGNHELFRLDLTSGALNQVTDTRGGAADCTSGGGEPYAPLPSTDGHIASIGGRDGSQYGPQRSERNGFAFGAVRTVPVVAGNTPPKLEVEGATAIAPGEYFSLLARAGDRDGEIPVLFAQVGGLGLREGASFTLDRNDPQARFVWRPTVDDAGEHLLRVGAFDARGGETVREVMLAVCRFRVDAADRRTIAEALFAQLPAGCGDADRNADGVLSAADLL